MSDAFSSSRFGRRGERAARDEEFVAFAVAATPRLRRAAFLMCRDWQLAEDLTQLTLARMYASWARLWRIENLEAYSRRVLMNAVFDRRRRHSDAEVVLAELPDRGEPSGESTADLHVILLRALATLPPRDQAVVVLRHWEDQSVETVAEILGLTTSSVKMRSLRALQKLRALLGEDFARQ